MSVHQADLGLHTLDSRHQQRVSSKRWPTWFLLALRCLMTSLSRYETGDCKARMLTTAHHHPTGICLFTLAKPAFMGPEGSLFLGILIQNKMDTWDSSKLAATSQATRNPLALPPSAMTVTSKGSKAPSASPSIQQGCAQLFERPFDSTLPLDQDDVGDCRA